MLRLLASLLLVASLVAGALSAATVYLVPLEYDSQRLRGLTLNAPAGAVAGDDGPPVPLVNKGDELTDARIAKLRAAGVRYVRVKEFAFSRWPGRWWFVGSVGGFFIAALLLRRARPVYLTAARGAAVDEPEQVLESLSAELDALREEIVRLDDRRARLELLLRRLSGLQKRHIAAFVDARPLLVARYGLAGYAEVMDSFAGGERQLNRSWSAAADADLDEALDALQAAAARFSHATAKLREKTSPSPSRTGPG